MAHLMPPQVTTAPSLVAILLLLLGAPRLVQAQKTDAVAPFRMGMSAHVLTGVSENDAPQVGQQLVALATSPNFITGMAAFRKGSPEPGTEKIRNAMRHLHETPRGQEVLIVFQSGALKDLPDAALDTARQLVAEHRRLCPGAAEPAQPAQSVTSLQP
jgi:hypothetical protein